MKYVAAAVVAVVPLLVGWLVLTGSRADSQELCHAATIGTIGESTESYPCPDWHQPSPDPEPYRPTDWQTVADIVGVWTDLVACESRFDPDAVGPTGDYGYFQFIAPTWRWTVLDLMDPPRPDLVTAHPYYGGGRVLSASIYDQLAAAEALAWSPRGQGLTAWTCYRHGRWGTCTAPSFGPTTICATTGETQMLDNKALMR